MTYEDVRGEAEERDELDEGVGEVVGVFGVGVGETREREGEVNGMEREGRETEREGEVLAKEREDIWRGRWWKGEWDALAREARRRRRNMTTKQDDETKGSPSALTCMVM